MRVAGSRKFFNLFRPKQARPPAHSTIAPFIIVVQRTEGPQDYEVSRRAEAERERALATKGGEQNLTHALGQDRESCRPAEALAGA